MTPYETATMVGAAFRIAEAKVRAAGGSNGPEVVRALRTASVVWADDDRLNGFDLVGAAMMVADSYGVGVVFLDSIGDAAVDAAMLKAQKDQAEAEQVKAQIQASVAYAEAMTTNDRSYVEQVMAQIKAAPDKANQILASAYEYTPSAVAARALKEASDSYLAAMKAAEDQTKERLKNAYNAIADAAKRGRDYTMYFLGGFVAINLVGLYYLTKNSGKIASAGAKAGAAAAKYL